MKSLHLPSVVVVGNGMVGCRVLERLVDLGASAVFRVTAIGEEPRPAYDRVHLSEYFGDATEEDLTLKPVDWYRESGVELLLNVRVEGIDRAKKILSLSNGDTLSYDYLILATGSSPFVPPIEGRKKQGVFVYRTLQDLDEMMAYAQGRARGTVLGGGLLGLEAANALQSLGLNTSVVEFAPRLMPRQLDDAGGEVLKAKVEALGIDVFVGHQTERVLGEESITGLMFSDQTTLETDMLVVSAGIRPRDELARECGLEVGPRGGVIVDDYLRTSDPAILAVGEVALHRGTIYGLVGPGYAMAEVVASVVMGTPKRFSCVDMSTKLKLLGVDVASFGDALDEDGEGRAMVLQDGHRGVYKRLNLSADGTRLVGGILVGDASDYGALLQWVREETPLPESPDALLMGSGGSENPLASMELPDSAQVCSCENVTRGELRACIHEQELVTLGEVKRATGAGTGCGGCAPLVASIFKEEMAAVGLTLSDNLCEHFPCTRTELFNIIRIERYASFQEVLQGHGTGSGCEICKPTVASCIASLWNEPAFKHDTIQDTNDRFMANIQRGGTYSVIPRIPGGEITPEKLIVLGEVAKKYDLYAKITGGQRVDLLGARVEQLPHIWEELVAAGFESGHAYAKGLRTVKSCVGTAWCRFAVGNSLDLAVHLENRYKGIRSPHKLKSAVSGCTRECAEAQSKDFGVIATDKGWNLYVCGNGGAQPRHADLLATDLDEETLVRTIDRFLMYYIRTADKLERTARWLENLEGGIDRLREIVVDDALGLADTLEAEMERLVGAYQCEWRALLESPAAREKFRHFVNSPAPDSTLEFVESRGQKRPEVWPGAAGKSSLPIVALDSSGEALEWVRVAGVQELPEEGGACVKYRGRQIAVFHFASTGRWYATQNLCPHKEDMVLARGLTGSSGSTLKVACPHHKKTFDLETGAGLSDPSYSIDTYPLRVVGEDVLLFLPRAWREDEEPAVAVKAEPCERVLRA